MLELPVATTSFYSAAPLGPSRPRHSGQAAVIRLVNYALSAALAFVRPNFSRQSKSAFAKKRRDSPVKEARSKEDNWEEAPRTERNDGSDESPKAETPKSQCVSEKYACTR
ncbi:hypothetical protein KM043_006963 [Ampulex compressa]|nr:hypothetical protein KM043_006963 [Ampulex compressa]